MNMNQKLNGPYLLDLINLANYNPSIMFYITFCLWYSQSRMKEPYTSIYSISVMYCALNTGYQKKSTKKTKTQTNQLDEP